MKSLVAITLGFFAVLGSSPALCNTIFPLAVPPDLPKGGTPALRTCVSTKFNADDSSVGTCASAVVYGRYSSTFAVYAASWDNGGNLLSHTPCGSVVTAYAKPPVWTYLPGFDATTCYLPANGSPDVSVYDPALGHPAWFGYVSTSTDGAYELLTLGRSGYINQF